MQFAPPCQERRFLKPASGLLIHTTPYMYDLLDGYSYASDSVCKERMSRHYCVSVCACKYERDPEQWGVIVRYLGRDRLKGDGGRGLWMLCLGIFFLVVCFRGSDAGGVGMTSAIFFFTCCSFFSLFPNSWGGGRRFGFIQNT